MRGNSFGEFFTITTFGESHGVALGAVIDGVPAGLSLSEADLEVALGRRRPGQSSITTSRAEADEPEILSGVFEGKTLGSPICVIVRNHDARSKDYDPNYYRTGHADRVWQEKFGHRDHRGGGRASGRETLARVIGGVVAEKLIPDVKIVGFTRQIGPHRATTIPENLSRDMVDAHPTRCPDPAAAEAIQAALEQAKSDGDSFGGIVEIQISGAPIGLGEPVFRKAKALLPGALMSVGAVVGVTLGDAHDDAQTRGLEFHQSAGGELSGISASANGIQGGITNGETIRLLVYFKPASTVGSMAKEGRHDPCIVPRAIPVLESMCALVMADLALAQRLDRAFACTEPEFSGNSEV